MSEPKICPYPGLRPFTEEESIFFKGRDEHIQQIVAQLEEKKFVMLTGASGDGKSSIVYAGVMPNARAGFFKAKFNNWVIADFRPERSPLKSLVSSLAKQLALDPEHVEKELRCGFSALIDLYKSSKYYLNTESEEYKNADIKQQKLLKRKAANLFLLVDQFEEFFTNKENFNQGKASLDSQLVINLVLETAKIALEQDIPIYIICTMRSDYIGQCAAFRGLPEYIGFSQFFVPRLKRKEMYQVIQEPAELSGCKISNRLTEILINELREGFDQLPVLQHALHQIWEKADRGNEEMDLIHLAKLSGIPIKYLPDNDQVLFKTWYEKVIAENDFLKEIIIRDFTTPSLENVLNTHANELYETAHLNCEKYSKNIKIEAVKAKQIIKTAFQCLTKIDASRAVRNRMTLEEITNIINNPDVSWEKVGIVLNIFREQGNTFLSPFIQIENSDTQILNKNTVLDITHESLIRNWELLNEWAKEEHENWLNYLDFQKQMQRWVDNGKTKGFLLPIGSFTFFENWYKQCKPNKYWLVKYDESVQGEKTKLKKAQETLDNANEFLRKSAWKHIVSRTIMRFGPNRIAATIGLVFLFTAILYYTFDFRKKQNNYVINEITEKSISLLESKYIKPNNKAKFIINYERKYPNSFEKLLINLPDTLAFDIAIEAFKSVENISDENRKQTNPMVKPLVLFIVKTTHKMLESDKYKDKDEYKLNKLNQIIKLYFFLDSWDKELAKCIDIHSFVKQENTLLQSIISRVSEKNYNIDKISAFNQAIEFQLTLYENSSENIKLLNLLSPFENESKNSEGEKNFNRIFQKEKRWQIDWQNSFSHNGGYQILSYLYASVGNFEKIRQCQDSVIKHNPDYYKFYNHNFSNIITCLLKYKFFPSEQAEDLLRKYNDRFKLKILKTVDGMRDNISNLYYYSYDINRASKYEDCLLYKAISDEGKLKIQEYYMNLVQKECKTPDELNFNLAVFYKRLGTLVYRMYKDSIKSEPYFKKCFEYYAKITEKYLAEDYVLGNEGTTESRLIKKSIIFLYPLNITNSDYWDPYSFWNVKNFPFLTYLFSQPENFKYYRTDKDIAALERFFIQYYSTSFLWSCPFKYNKEYNISIYESGINKVKNLGLFERFKEPMFFKLVEIADMFKKDSVKQALQKWSVLKETQKSFPEKGMYDKEEYLKKAYYNIMNRLCIFLSVNDRSVSSNNEISEQMTLNTENFNDIFHILNSFPEKSIKKNMLIDILIELQKKGPVEQTFRYMDSLFCEIDKNPKFGNKLFKALGMIGSRPVYNLSQKLIKNIKDEIKPFALAYFIQGVCYTRNFYMASTFIPDYFSSTNELELYTQIIHASILEKNNFIEDELWQDINYEMIRWGDGSYETESNEGFYFIEE